MARFKTDLIDWHTLTEMCKGPAERWIKHATKKQLQMVLTNKVYELDYEAFRDDSKACAQELCEIYVNGFAGPPVVGLSKSELQAELRELYKEYGDYEGEGTDDDEQGGRVGQDDAIRQRSTADGHGQGEGSPDEVAGDHQKPQRRGSR